MLPASVDEADPQEISPRLGTVITEGAGRRAWAHSVLLAQPAVAAAVSK
jgi:hypothetical protein